MGLFNTSKEMLDAIKSIVTDGRKQYAEEQQEMDKIVAEKILSPKQKKIAAVAGHKDKIDAADFAALRAGKKVAEEVEELDEISKDTLKSYIKGASQDLPRVGNTLGRVQTGASKDNERLKNSISKVISNRYNGINKAVEKLTKEEVESVDELSKPMLATYIRRASDPTHPKSNVNLSSLAADKLSKGDNGDDGQKEDKKAYNR